MKNYLGQTLALALWVIVLCSGLSLLPDGLRMGQIELRKMDIFAAIRLKKASAIPPNPELAAADSLFAPEADTGGMTLKDPFSADSLVTGPYPPVDSLFFGKIIEDYTPGQQGLSGFFEAIDAIKSRGRSVRVAFYGDSFVEGDILVGDLRDTLQELWGGEGVGFVPITSEVARFKRTLQHDYSNWVTYSIVKNHDKRVPFGINGYIYYPNENAHVRYKGTHYFKNSRLWSKARIFYAAAEPQEIQLRINGNPAESRLLPAKNGLGMLEVARQEMSILEFSIPSPSSDLGIYGASLENGPGIYIDNFSIRGNTGGRLRLLKPGLIRQFDEYQKYDLIVVQMGLNAVTNSLDNIQWYHHELDLTFKHLRNCFPTQPILVISVADRGGRVEDGFGTMPTVPAIARMQREVARKHGLLFYDLFHGMGGPGTMIAFSNTQPALANKDFTHLTHAGGHIIGQLFARLFLYEKSRYSAR